MTEVLSIRLDELPVSINDLWMPNRGGRGLILTPKYRAWKEATAWEIKRICGSAKLEGGYALDVRLRAPDNRARDIDNFAFKALNDAAQLAGVITNDSKCRRLSAEWSDDGPAVQAWLISTKG